MFVVAELEVLNDLSCMKSISNYLIATKSRKEISYEIPRYKNYRNNVYMGQNHRNYPGVVMIKKGSSTGYGRNMGQEKPWLTSHFTS